ncbi:MAG TPA: DNA double-strand break repair nuclease NurA [Anaerolineaceae bacterium]|nr:DNA double-strand break repair nuclease NurA [Anaerolineaceae bacterium]HOG77439.1 DNA double-strand break repair nuclease NurA [Anaerolineaceae bacterium]
MPVNYPQIEISLADYASKEKDNQALLLAQKEQLWRMLSEPELELDAMREKISRAETLLRNLYCAKPVEEQLLTHKALPALPKAYTLIAADGSQIVPNRHRPVQFCVLNIGVIKVQRGSGLAPEISVFSRLLEHERLLTAEGHLVGDEDVSLYRDLEERQVLLEAAVPQGDPIITLTDGPLDVYENVTTRKERQELQNTVRTIHQQIEARGVLSAGYIDKPGSELISRMLSVLHTPDAELAAYDDTKREIRGISDAELLEGLLGAGERSAVFEAVTKGDSKGSLKVHFFYLNASGAEQRNLARVEFPAWVSGNPRLVDMLHSVIYHEAMVLDTHPYPYALHRAHELAVITMPEHEQVEAMLVRELEKAGARVGRRSNKDWNKGLTRA